MAFEYIGHAESVARNQQLWGIAALVAAVILGIFFSIKGKPGAYWIVAVAVAAIGAYFLYQSRQLASVDGDWIIRISQTSISWQSPAPGIDRSFELSLGNLDFIDRSAMQSQSDSRPVYHLIPKAGQPIQLSSVSGVNLEAFITTLTDSGFEIRETGRYYQPSELRNK